MELVAFLDALRDLQAEGYTIIGHGHDMRRLCETAKPPIRCIDGYFALDAAFPTARPKTDGSLSMGILVPGLGVAEGYEHRAESDCIHTGEVYAAIYDTPAARSA